MEDILIWIVEEAVLIAETRKKDESGFDNISISQIGKEDLVDSVVKGNLATNIHPLHSHLLLYSQVSDSKQILYTMDCVKNILQANPRLAICTLSTTNLNSNHSSRSHQIQTLLARHRKSVFGRSFVGKAQELRIKFTYLHFKLHINYFLFTSNFC